MALWAIQKLAYFSLYFPLAISFVFPDSSNNLVTASWRMRDLIEPFRSFFYYHPKQYGSCSFKDVLPALTGKSYKDMDIQEGGTASLRFYQTHFCDCDEEKRKKVRRALLEYCNLDTEGMVGILRELVRMCS
jgi:hypothetical protein